MMSSGGRSVLSQSMRLDDKTLIENARSRARRICSISTRRTLSGAVTDVLVQRGNDEVIQSTVNNPGAGSPSAATRLVSRAEATTIDLHRPASIRAAASI